MKKHIFKVLACILATLMILPVFTSCQSSTENKKYSIVCTIFPEYDFIMNILKDNAELFDVTLLIKNGTDMHSYQPSVADIAKISESDLFVYVGSQSQNWVNNILKNVDTNKTKVISLAEQFEDSLCNHPVSKQDHGDHNHSFDEHLWLSLRKSQKIVDILCQEISNIDIENKDIYQSNADQYKSKLDLLDKEFESSIERAKYNTLIFADRFPFIYLLEDYGIEYHAAFTGCSTESDAGVKTILLLAEKLEQLDLPAIMIIETSDETVANTVIAESGRSEVLILTLNSCQTITKNQIDSGTTYLDVMKNNLENIKIALGCEA